MFRGNGRFPIRVLHEDGVEYTALDPRTLDFSDRKRAAWCINRKTVGRWGKIDPFTTKIIRTERTITLVPPYHALRGAIQSPVFYKDSRGRTIFGQPGAIVLKVPRQVLQFSSSFEAFSFATPEEFDNEFICLKPRQVGEILRKLDKIVARRRKIEQRGERLKDRAVYLAGLLINRR